MEHPHVLLMLVLKQHYQNRLHIIDSAKKVINDYKSDRNANYEKTLGLLYQLMNDLPPDILLYFLTMVPLPEVPVNNTSTLIELMKQMHSTNLLDNMRPTLLQYLNNQVSTPMPIEASTSDYINPTTIEKVDISVESKIQQPIVRSVIDENIKKEKNKNRRKVKAKPRVSQRRMYPVKSLTYLCALNILKNEKIYKKKYEALKKQAWNLVNTNIEKTSLNQCFSVIRDTNKKIKWLTMVKSGDVSLDVIKDEYGSSEVFCMEKHLHTLSDDVLHLSEVLEQSIDKFLHKC